MAQENLSSCSSSELKRVRQPSLCSPDDVMWSTTSPDATWNSNPNKKIRNGNTIEPPCSDLSGPDFLSPESSNHLQPSQPAVTQEQGDDGGGKVNGLSDTHVKVSDAVMPSGDSGLSYEEVSHMDEANGQAAEDNPDDDVSAISNLSGLSGEAWKPTAGPMAWVHRHIEAGSDPRELLQKLVTSDTAIPDDLDNMTLWRIILNLVAEPPRRKRLKHINTMEDVISLLKSCSRIMVLTGAGVSVSCGIPDFRSKDGIYVRLAEEYPDLPDPQAMFDIQYFTKNQGPFFKFAKEIYPGQFEPSQSHKFIRLLETHSKLLRNYTQNIDTLEQVAGIERVIQCHGSFATATCMVCKHKAEADDIKQDIMNQVIPRCPRCPSDESLAIMKPDIVFFGESLPEHFHRQMELDKDNCDLLIVMGSSLKVRPVALIPNSLPAEVPQVLINREPLRHLNFDVELLGDCDSIIAELCHRLGEEWTSICPDSGPMRQVDKGEILTPPLSGRTTPIRRCQEGGKLSADPGCSMDVKYKDNGPLETHTGPMQTENPPHPASGLCEHNSPKSPVTQIEHQPATAEELSSCGTQAMHTTDCSSAPEPPSPHSNPENKSPSQPLVASSDVSHSLSTSPCNNESAANRDTLNPDSQLDNPVATDPAADLEAEQPGPSGPGRPEADMAEADMAELEELRACWKPRVINLGTRLPDGTFLFLPPNRYVFRGAEVYEDDDDDSSSSSSSSGSSMSSPSNLPSPPEQPSGSGDAVKAEYEDSSELPPSTAALNLGEDSH